MPQEFINCVKNGGKVRTVTGPDKKMQLKVGEYVHVCFLKGAMYKGEIRKKEKR